jgi:hypothetical protein
MQVRKCGRLLIAAVAIAAMGAPACASAAGGRPAFGDHDGRGKTYDRGYRDGLHDGENDARHARPFVIRLDGRRDEDFRRGYERGYRESYDRGRVVIQPAPLPQRAPGVVFDRRLPSGYQDPAFARGFSDGYREGVDDGHDRDRYDPVRHGEYRDGDKGYSRDYGPRNAYKNNYRAGFRQGYDTGYRDGANRRR